jgi:uncharacterized protein
MPEPLHPGVYVEEIPNRAKSIVAADTSTAIFIGFTTKGTVGEPIRIGSWDDYVRLYGGCRDTGPSAKGDPLAYSVAAFFQNGGTRAYIVRVALGTTERPLARATCWQTMPGDSTKAVQFTAINEGAWVNGMVAQIAEDATGTYRVEIGRISTEHVFAVQEQFDDVSFAPESPRYAESVINGVSELVSVNIAVIAAMNAGAGKGPSGELTGGSDGDLPGTSSYDSVIAKLEERRDINIVCLPGQAWDVSGKPIIEKAIAHAEAMHDRLVVVDPPSDAILDAADAVNNLHLSTSSYAVMYYPWINAANQAKSPGAPDTVLVPPAGYAAGIWARIDIQRGVWKAPAGREASLVGVASLSSDVSDTGQDTLNPLGVNCIRNLPTVGPVLWGARTLATAADPEWRYVPVRRTAAFIERSICDGIQWAVFEPNSQALWSSLRSSITSFMDNFYHAGAFEGSKPTDAYFVQCGLGETMTQNDIDLDLVIMVVGFAPLKPAEFVIIRLQLRVNQQ